MLYIIVLIILPIPEDYFYKKKSVLLLFNFLRHFSYSFCMHIKCKYFDFFFVHIKVFSLIITIYIQLCVAEYFRQYNVFSYIIMHRVFLQNLKHINTENMHIPKIWLCIQIHIYFMNARVIHILQCQIREQIILLYRVNTINTLSGNKQLFWKRLRHDWEFAMRPILELLLSQKHTRRIHLYKRKIFTFRVYTPYPLLYIIYINVGSLCSHVCMYTECT